MDVALLHMASVLQRSKLLTDAATILEVAISLNSSNLLYHYVLAGIYVVSVFVCVCVCVYVIAVHKDVNYMFLVPVRVIHF